MPHPRRKKAGKQGAPRQDPKAKHLDERHPCRLLGSTNYYLIEKTQHRHWIAQAQQVGLGAAAAEQLIEEVIQATESVIGEVGKLLLDDFPMDVAEAVFG